MNLKRSASCAALVFATALLFQGCVKQGAPINAVGTPHFVQQSQPDSAAETGIGQDPNTGGIFLQWYTTEGANEYRVYRSDTVDAQSNPFNFSIVGDLTSTSSPSDTATIDASLLNVGVRYYYYVKAYASDGAASVPSDTISFVLLERPQLIYPSVNAALSKGSLYFEWFDHTGGGYTVIRVKDIYLIPSVWVWVSNRFQIFETQPSKSFNFDGTAILPLTSGHSYQWRVDRFNIDGTTGLPDAGSRSVWGTFSIK